MCRATDIKYVIRERDGVVKRAEELRTKAEMELNKVIAIRYKPWSQKGHEEELRANNEYQKLMDKLLQCKKELSDLSEQLRSFGK